MWYLIVSIPDLCTLTYFYSYSIYSAVIMNIYVIFSIIERLSIKRLTEDVLLIIDVCRDTRSINKHFSNDMQEVRGSLK